MCCLCFLTVSFIFGTVSSGRLNAPSLLLPYNANEPTNYKLEVPGGNYRWTSSNPDIVAVTSRSDSSAAIISAVSTVRQRQLATISAENSTTGEEYRCDVVLDALHSISIEATSKELTLEGLPSVFKVKGKNANGETFSSLSGIEFEWKESSKSGNVLRLVNFDDSSYETDPSVLHWERKNTHGFEVLVKGVALGIGKLRVQPVNITKSDIKDVRFQEIEVLVKSNIKFKQHILHLIPLMKFPLSIQRYREGKAEDITSLPDDYGIKIKNQNVATVTEHFEIIANELGQTSVRLHRRGLKQGKKFYSSVQVNVVEPSYITLHVSPENNWAFQELHAYIVTVKLFDVYHHEIDITENLQVQVKFPSKHFRINFSSLNGTYHIVQATVVGSGDITAELLGVMDVNGKISKQKTPIRTMQHFVVYQSLQIYPPVVLLPWLKEAEINHTLTFKVTGGTGMYKWSSSNTTIADVHYSSGAKSNVATVVAHNLGDITIDVCDGNYGFLTVSASVSLQSIAELDVMPTIVETQPGNDIILPVSIYGYEDERKTKLKMFDDCSKIPLSVKLVDPTKFTYIEETEYIPMGKGCQSLQFTCKLPGHSRLFINYKLNNEIGSTAIIGCHKPLKPVYPDRLLVMALGTSVEVAFEGGPRAWPMYSKGYYDELISQKSGFLTIQAIRDQYRYNKDLHVYQVICTSIDQSILEIKVGNVPSATLPNPAKDDASIKLVCTVPNTLHLRVHKTFQRRLTADTLPSSKVTTRKGRDIEVDLNVKDNIGRKFANLSSFDVRWELSDYTLAKLKSHNDIVTEVNGANGYRKFSRGYQILHLTGKPGVLKVTAKIVGYQNHVLKSHGISKEVNFLPISETIELKLKSDKDNIDDVESCTKDGCPNA